MTDIVTAILTTLIYVLSLWLAWTVNRSRHEPDISFTSRLFHPRADDSQLRRRAQAKRRGRGR